MENIQAQNLFEQALQFLRQGKPTEAMARFEQVRQIDASFPNIKYHIARTHLRLEEFNKAVHVLEQVAVEEPRNVIIFRELGQAYILLEDLGSAEFVLLRALGLDPQHAETHFNLGLCYAKQGKNGLARQRFIQALHLQPDYQKARYWLADCLALIEGYEESLVQLFQILEDDPDNFLVQQRITQMQERIRDKEKSKKTANSQNLI